MKDKCKNCGGWKGVHHFETGQCPVNGHEAPVGKPDVWTFTTFEQEDDKRVALETAADELSKAAQKIVTQFNDCDSCEGSGLDVDGESACAVCGGHGFNPCGDIRQDRLDLIAAQLKYAAVR